MRSGRWSRPTWRSCLRRRRSAATPCAGSSTACATWSRRARPGGGCPTTAAVGDRPPAGAALAGRGRVRGRRGQPACRAAHRRRARAGTQGGGAGQPHAPLHPRKRPPRRLRRGQAQEGVEGAHGGGHAGPPARAARHPGRGRRPRRGQPARQGRAGQDRRERRGGLRRPGLRGKARRRGRAGAWRPPRGRKAPRGQARLRPAPQALGRGTLLRPEHRLPPSPARPRATAANHRRPAPRRLRLPRAQGRRRALRRRCQTAARRESSRRSRSDPSRSGSRR